MSWLCISIERRVPFLDVNELLVRIERPVPFVDVNELLVHSGKAADIEECQSLVAWERGDNYKNRHGATLIS